MSDMYPHDSTYYKLDTPEDQKVADRKTEGKVRAGLEIIEDIIKHFEERIAFYDTITAIPDEVIANPDELMVYVAGNKLTKQNLTQEKEWLTALRDQYKR